MKFVCQVCGYSSDSIPEKCPICGASSDKFLEQKGEKVWADEHRIGVAKDVDKEVLEGLQAHFAGECTEVGMYLAMSRQADREGYRSPHFRKQGERCHDKEARNRQRIPIPELTTWVHEPSDGRSDATLKGGDRAEWLKPCTTPHS